MHAKGLQLLAFSLFVSSFFLAFNANSQQLLRFRPAETFKEKQIIGVVRSEQADVPLLLAPIDLNDDAIDEYVVKPQFPGDCPQKPLCPHFIMAFQDYTPLEIGRFDAHKIEVSGKKTYGVRQIIVYNQRQNDFAQTTTLWNPFLFRYE